RPTGSSWLWVYSCFPPEKAPRVLKERRRLRAVERGNQRVEDVRRQPEEGPQRPADGLRIVTRPGRHGPHHLRHERAGGDAFPPQLVRAVLDAGDAEVPVLTGQQV